MSEPGTKTTVEDFVLELECFIVMSAKLCITEPPLYGPFRLLDTARRLVDIAEHVPGYKKSQFLQEVKKQIDEKMWIVQWDLEGFKKFIDDLVLQFATEIKRS